MRANCWTDNPCKGRIVCLVAFLLAPLAGAETFEETFDTDPIAGGRFVLPDGDAGRFSYDGVSKTLTASYKTDLATNRLIHQLGQAYTDEDDFEFEFDFEILSLWANPLEFAQIAFGLMNSATTGTDRAGGTGGSAYDICSFDYFPNITAFGGPTLGPTLINTDKGQGFFSAIQFEFGDETDMTTEGSLPLNTPLTARVVYDGRRRVATLTVADTSGALLINTQGGRGSANKPGGFDSDNTTIQTEDFGQTFAVDAVGIFLWNDSFAAGVSVIADLEFSRIFFQGTKRPQAGPGDLDADGDADTRDFQTFSNCFNGPGAGVRFGCQRSDLDNDDADVDTTDFQTFSNCFNGPNRAPNCP